MSSTLIALAFIGQMSRMGTAFYAFALILLPVLAFVGLVTFLRLVQSSIEDIAYARRIGVLREFYLRVSPELKPYVLAVRETRQPTTCQDHTLAPSTWQLMLTAAGMIAVVNSVVVAACARLTIEAAGVTSLPVPLAFGAVIGTAALCLQHRHHRRERDADGPEDVDRAAIFLRKSQPADSA